VRQYPITEIEYSTRYDNSLSKLEQSLQDRLADREKLFRANAYYPGLNTGKLKGALGNQGIHSWDVDARGRYRVLFVFTDPGKAKFLNVGDHDIYK